MEVKEKKKLIPLDKDYLAWHYTTPDVFIKLLNNEIYATHYRYLNDDLEISFAHKACQVFIENEINDNQLELFYKSLLNHDIFVMCFSTVKDSLPQWRAYASKYEGGFAIDFSRNKLCSALNDYANSNDCDKQKDDITWNWIKCRYSEDYLLHRIQALKRLAARNPTLSPSLRQFLKGFSNAASFNEEQKQELTNSIQECIRDCNRDCTIMSAIMEMALTYKHPTFATECEERILGFGFNPKGMEDICESFDIQSNHRKQIEYIGGKPRIKIPIASVRDCIEYVMVSPHGNKDRNKLLAELFRDKYDLKFDIEMSSSPYNGN